MDTTKTSVRFFLALLGLAIKHRNANPAVAQFLLDYAVSFAKTNGFGTDPLVVQAATLRF